MGVICIRILSIGVALSACPSAWTHQRLHVPLMHFTGRASQGSSVREMALFLQCRYLENVPTIVPLLEKEYRIALRRLEDTQDELSDLHPERYTCACATQC